jgi:hypothetical protein
MINPHEQTIRKFGIAGQRAKLIEELVELLAELISYKHMSDPDVINEMADVQNILASIDIWAQGGITTAADTKMLRTQIRMRTGYYDERV